MGGLPPETIPLDIGYGTPRSTLAWQAAARASAERRARARAASDSELERWVRYERRRRLARRLAWSRDLLVIAAAFAVTLVALWVIFHGFGDVLALR